MDEKSHRLNSRTSTNMKQPTWYDDNVIGVFDHMYRFIHVYFGMCPGNLHRLPATGWTRSITAQNHVGKRTVHSLLQWMNWKYHSNHNWGNLFIESLMLVCTSEVIKVLFLMLNKPVVKQIDRPGVSFLKIVNYYWCLLLLLSVLKQI